jgi:hypothetical protein
MLRNHPSLAIWVGGNEYPPPSDITAALKTLVQTYGNEISYIDYSLTGGFGPSDGPYTIQDLSSFYTFTDSFAFNPEIGTPFYSFIHSFIHIFVYYFKLFYMMHYNDHLYYLFHYIDNIVYYL